MKDREEDLTLFIEMRKREKEQGNILFQNSDELGQPLESQHGGSPTYKIFPSALRRMAVDDFLNSDSEKSDYDWLLTPPGTPHFPSFEESHKSPVGNHDTPKGHYTLLKSRLANPADPSKSTAPSRQLTPSAGLNSSYSCMRRPSSSSGGFSATSSRTATRRLTAPVSKPSRSSTPTSRPTLPPKTAVTQSRSSTPAKTSTPTPRSSIPPATKPASRPATPTKRPSTPSNLHPISAPPNSSVTKSCPATSYITRSSVTKSAPATSSISRPSLATSYFARPSLATSSATKSGPITNSNTTRSGPMNIVARSVPATSHTKSSSATSKCVAPSRGTSPTVRSRTWIPSEMPGFSHQAPPNLKTSLPERPSSASRGRPGAPSSRLSSVESGPTVRPRRQSCSPLRGKAPNGTIFSGSSVPASSRSRMTGSHIESPVVIGTKMVERVVNLRRLAPPKQDNPHFRNNSAGKTSLLPDSAGFGRTLSKKSLDMAMRHMDIRQSIPNSLRPLLSNIPASSLYSVRSGSTRSRGVSVSDSPLATSSNASSEQSVSNNAFCLDGNEVEHDICSEKKGEDLSFISAGKINIALPTTLN